MTLKVYCDANIFLDYLKERRDNIRPLHEFAFQFFSAGWNCKFHLIISDWLLEELSNHLTEKQIESVLKEFRDKNKLITVNEEEGDRKKAKKISEHWKDPLHAILANKSGADYLTTRNMQDYNEECNKLIKIVFPEFLIGPDF